MSARFSVGPAALPMHRNVAAKLATFSALGRLHGYVTPRAWSTATGCSYKAATSFLSGMWERGYIDRIEPGRYRDFGGCQ